MRRAGAAVDEHELRPEDEALALHVGALRLNRSPAVLVDHLAVRWTNPELAVGVKSTLPVTMSGPWNSSPIFFQ